MTLNQSCKTRSGGIQLPERGRGCSGLPTEPGAGRELGRPQGVAGADAGREAVGFESFDLRHAGCDDALMQPSSSASMLLAAEHTSLRECKIMTTAAEIRVWMKETMAVTGLSIKAWATASGVAASTIHRALKDDYQFVTSNRTMSKLASAAGVAPPDGSTTGPQLVGAEFLPIRYDVGAGLWQEVTDAQVFLGVGTVAPDPAFSGFPQWLERVQGDSMDKDYRDGELVHVVDAIALGYAPQHGDHVILVRRRIDGAEMERTIKEVVRKPGGLIEFWPRSNNPRWASPVRLNQMDGGDDQTVEVEISALVIGSYRPRRR